MLSQIVFLILFKESLANYNSNYDGNGFRKHHFRRVFAKYNYTHFAELKNYQFGATLVPQGAYPFMARVLHSVAHLCSAVCFEARLFATSAKCAYTLKINYTAIHYMGTDHKVRAIVFPSNRTKHMHEDIAIIVIEDTHQGPWETTKLYQPARTDANFDWFDNIPKPDDSKVVGFAIHMGHSWLKYHTKYELTELKVHILNATDCAWIFTKGYLQNGFKVPCYYTCTLVEFQRKAEDCNKIHGVNGGCVMSEKLGGCVGLATWTNNAGRGLDLPIGFAMFNSENFYKDHECARKIRDDVSTSVSSGYYQSLCD